MFCYNCGNKASDDAVFCDNCGTKIKDEDSGFSENKHEFRNSDGVNVDIDFENIKNKIKDGAKVIQTSNVFRTFISFLKGPVTTGREIINKLGIKEILILMAIFVGINILTTIISMDSLNGRNYDYNFYYGRDMLGRFVWKMAGTMILAYILGIAISSLITALFLKIGNGEDVFRKGVAISVTTTGISTCIGLIVTLAIKVSVLIAIAILVIGILLTLNYYFMMFMENVKISSPNIKSLLPVVSIAVYGLITMFILTEVLARSFAGNIMNMIDMYNFF